jgi:hypothetical protein
MLGSGKGPIRGGLMAAKRKKVRVSKVRVGVRFVL